MRLEIGEMCKFAKCGVLSRNFVEWERLLNASRVLNCVPCHWFGMSVTRKHTKYIHRVYSCEHCWSCSELFTPDVCTQNANRLCSPLPSIFPQFKTWLALRSLSPSTKLRLNTPHFANLHTSPFSSLIIAEKNWKYCQLLYCYECTSPVFGAILACCRHCVPFPIGTLFFYLVKKYKNRRLWELLSHQAADLTSVNLANWF